VKSSNSGRTSGEASAQLRAAKRAPKYKNDWGDSIRRFCFVPQDARSTAKEGSISFRNHANINAIASLVEAISFHVPSAGIMDLASRKITIRSL
jgi:hypothetical protein